MGGRSGPAVVTGYTLAPSLWVAVFLIGSIFLGALAVAADGDLPDGGHDGGASQGLSQTLIDAYLDGREMGMANVAEVNRYPSPRHVQALAEELGLTEEQRRATADLYQETHQEAVRLGREIVALEQKLIRIFAWGQASEEILAQIVEDIGSLQARLRLTHLAGHVRERKILTKEQLQRYEELGRHGLATGGNGTKRGCTPQHHHGS